jgi:hypothetical protein
VNPQSSPQPIIASVRLPNGQMRQIVLNSQQVAAHQQLAQLQAQGVGKRRWGKDEYTGRNGQFWTISINH